MADSALVFASPVASSHGLESQHSATQRGYGTYLVVTILVMAAVMAIGIVGASFAGVLRIDAIESGSMAPAIPLGSDVAVTPEPISALRVGQVIAFVPPAPYPQVTVVHEVAGVKRAMGVAVITTRGVANKVNDPWRAVVRGHVWHVIGSVAFLGWVTNFMRIGIVQILVIALVVSTAFAGIGRLVARRR